MVKKEKNTMKEKRVLRYFVLNKRGKRTCESVVKASGFAAQA